MEKIIRKKIRKILMENFIKEGETKKIPMDIIVQESDKNDIWKIRMELVSRGFKMFIVGGAVRDAVKNAIKLQKNPMDTTIDVPKDFDLATDAPPDVIQKMFERANFISNILQIGESFAIKFLVTKAGNQYELATFRSDIGGGRKPDSVKYETNPEEDAKRRDLTINALFFEIGEMTPKGFAGEVIDYVGGVEDIKNNVINTVGNAKDRFDDDPLRKIRAIRFAAKMGSNIPKNVADAIREGGTSLVDPTGKKVSSERVRDEFYKGVKSAKNVVSFLKLLNEFDFFKHIFGNLKINENNFIEERNPLILLANVLKNNNIKSVDSELNNQKYSTDEINCIIFLISLLSLDEKTVIGIKKLFSQKVMSAKPKINGKTYTMTEDVIDKFASINHIDKLKIKNLLRLVNEFKQPSALLMSIGYKQEELGSAIDRLQIEFFKNPDRVKDALESGNIDKIREVIFINKA